MKVTRLSTKGHVVIPEDIRRGLETGTAFEVSRQHDLIVLKPVEGLTRDEVAEMSELDRIWDDVDRGDCDSYTEGQFVDKLTEWRR